MNTRRVLECVAGIVIVLLVGGAGSYGVKLVAPASGGAVADAANIAALALAAVGLVLAGFLLRTWWALLIEPVVYLGTGVVYGLTQGGMSLATVDWFLEAILLVAFGIPIALLSLLGVVLGKRFMRARSAAPMA